MLEDARTSIARLVEVQSDDVLFTSGATEANALAILGHVRALRAEGRNDIHILYLPSAHASVVENAKILETENVSVEALPIKDCRVDTEALAKALRSETALITMDAVCGETGVIWNTREVANTIQAASKIPFSRSLEARQPLATKTAFPSRPLLHVDASQAPLTEKITRAHFGADMLTLDASKVGEVRGIGSLVAHRTIPLAPLYGGGGQERGLRPGSETPELAKEFAESLHAATHGREAFRASATRARAGLVRHLTPSIQNIFINESRTQAPHILNLSLPGRDTDYLVALMDGEGFAVSTRSACETDSEEGSRAVLALSGNLERARATLRISWGPRARASEFSRFAHTLVRAVAFIDNKG